MTVKTRILARLTPRQMRAVCDEVAVRTTDRRYAEALRSDIAAARRATPERILGALGVAELRALAADLGVPDKGSRAKLIETILGGRGPGAGSVPARRAGRRRKVNTAPVVAPRKGRAAASATTARRRNPQAKKKEHSKRRQGVSETTQQYRHKDQAVQRPDVGVQDQFRARREPRTYRYDSSLDPALSWDEQLERDLGEWLLGLIERAATEGEESVFAESQEWKGGGVRVGSTAEAVAVLRSISKPFLNWAGKAERHQIKVPSVPLFVHERHSTKAILDGIRHRKARGSTLDLFGDAQMDIRENLEAYEHKGPWQNRMILGDSLAVMNSLLEFEGMAGQVQMIYIDPPYGVKFGSNFQPFVRKRDVKHGGDDDMTREPEMVKAYRDTWELGLHSYLTYLRDRLIVAKELLNESGSVFVQISDENVHHVYELLCEVYSPENAVGLISFRKVTGTSAGKLSVVADYLVWFAKSKTRLKFRPLFRERLPPIEDPNFRFAQMIDGSRRTMTPEERRDPSLLPDGAKIFRLSDITSLGRSNYDDSFEFEGVVYRPGDKHHWKTNVSGMAKLASKQRIAKTGRNLAYVRFFSDFSFEGVDNLWNDTGTGGFGDEKIYVVQTTSKTIQRCMLMCTDPGDLVLDPTCGSGTTVYVAEQWGRRWITIDTSRVPLALARQRMLTATFPYYKLKSPQAGPAGGFVYKCKQNRKGEEIGGLVPHITLKSIANDEPPAMEVLVDRPEEESGVTRVAGPFVVEATIAPVQPIEAAGDGNGDGDGDVSAHIQRMTEVLRQSKTLRLPGNRELVLAGVRRTVDAEYLHAEANEGDNRVAIVFGPADGAVSASLVYEAGREAHYLKYDLLYFFGFAVEPGARAMIEDEKKLRIPAAYVAVTPDVAMSDLLKTTRASEIFSVTGLPDVAVRRAKKKGPEGQPLYEVELSGLDLFDPQTMDTESVGGENVPCWMLDSDYDGMSFYATQVFFPKTSAWDNLQRSLKATFEDSVWSHLAGTVSEPFVLGERRRVAVKVIDERGNELMRVLDVAE